MGTRREAPGAGSRPGDGANGSPQSRGWVGGYERNGIGTRPDIFCELVVIKLLPLARQSPPPGG
jgi:hypothetical protein